MTADDRLIDEILATFPDATEVVDDGPRWIPVCEGAVGALEVRDAPLNTGSTPPADGSRRHVTAAEPK